MDRYTGNNKASGIAVKFTTEKFDLQDSLDFCIMTEMNEFEASLKTVTNDVLMLIKGLKGDMAFNGQKAKKVCMCMCMMGRR